MDGKNPSEGAPARRRRESGFDPEMLWRFYVQSGGNLNRMKELPCDGMPKSLQTLRKYEKEHRWDERLKKELAAASPQEVRSLADANRFTLKRLNDLSEAILDHISPTKNEKGETVFQLPPEKFESTVTALLKLLDKIELMRGGVTSRTEVKRVIEVNLKVAFKTIGGTLREFIEQGAINPKLGRQIIDSFMSKIGRQEIVLDADAVQVQSLETEEDEPEAKELASLEKKAESDPLDALP